MGTYNRHVAFGLKIINRLGKYVRKSRGGDFFDSHCISNAHLPPSGGVAIRRVCLLVRSLVCSLVCSFVTDRSQVQ